MTETPIPRLILSLSLPAMTSLTLVAIYNVADALFVSSLGSGSTGVLSALLPLTALIQAIGFTIGMGSSSLISRNLGKGDATAAKCYSATAFWLALGCSGVLLLLGYFFTTPMVRLFGAPDSLLQETCRCARYLLAAAPFLVMGFILSNLLRGLGHTGAALLGIGTGSILNILLDPLFIFALDMGVTGTGLATLISQSIGTLVLLFLFLHHKHDLSLRPRDLSHRVKDYRRLLFTGMPSLFRQGLAMVAAILLNHQAAPFGEDTLAAMGIVGKIFMIFFSVSLGFGQGYQPAAGFNYGASHLQRLRQAFFFTLWCSVGIMTLLAVGLFIGTPAVLTLFSTESAVRDIARPALRSLCLIFPLLPPAALANLTFQAIGRPGLATFLAATRQGLFFIPLILLLPRFWGLPGLQYSQAAADFLTALCSTPFLILFVRRYTKKG